MKIFFLKYLLIISFIFSNINAQVDDKDLACYYLNHFNTVCEKLIENPKIWMRGEDSCVLGILDSLTSYITKENNIKYILILDTISTYSDGYISEAIQYCIREIFSKQPKRLINYLYENEKIGRKNNLKQYLIWFMIDEFALNLPEEQKSGVKVFKKKMSLIQKKYNFSSKEKLYFKSLVSEIIKKSH